MRKKFNITKYRKRLITTYISSDGSSEISVKRTSGKKRDVVISDETDVIFIPEELLDVVIDKLTKIKES